MLPSKELANCFVSNFNIGKCSSTPSDRVSRISISRDHTSLECQEIKQIFTKLDDHKNKYERNIIVTYTNDIPSCNSQRKSWIWCVSVFLSVFYSPKIQIWSESISLLKIVNIFELFQILLIVYVIMQTVLLIAILIF